MQQVSATSTSWASSHPRLSYWLRWLGVLPAALLAVILVSFPVHIAALVISNSNSEDGSNLFSLIPPVILERFLQALCAPIALVWAATKTAPSHRLYLAGIVVILYAMSLGAAMMWAGSQGYYSGRYWLEFAMVVALGFVGLAYSMYRVYEEEKQ